MLGCLWNCLVFLFCTLIIYFCSGLLIGFDFALPITAGIYVVGAAYSIWKIRQEEKERAATIPPPDPEVERQQAADELLADLTEDEAHGPAPYGGVIWDDEYTIDELIYKDGKYYINENSEEWEEDEESLH